MISGFVEAVAGVSCIDTVAESLSAVTGYTLVSRGDIPPQLLTAWGINGSSAGEEALLAAPIGSVKGGIRLLQIAGCERLPIRPDPQTWDTGGILDLNVRARNMDVRHREFTRAGWRGPSAPVKWQFGDKLVSEWLALGPDGLAFALIERLAPPLEPGVLESDVSAVFNSSQVVADMAASLDFYEGVLGFTKFLHISQPLLPEPGENPLGIPHNLVHQLDVEIAILSPDGTMDGSVELIRMHGLEGRDFSTRCHPCNLGLTALRFPVANVDQMVRDVCERGASLAMDPVDLTIMPYGQCRMLAVQAPEGAWLEFFQVLS